MQSPLDHNRRRFLTRAAVAASVVPLSTLALQLPSRRATAADRPEAEDGHAHDYVRNAADSDHAMFEAGSNCGNCAFWSGSVTDDHGGCFHPDFMTVLVAEEGWCSVYARGG